MVTNIDFVVFLPSFFLVLSSFYLLIVRVEGYCCTWWHSYCRIPLDEGLALRRYSFMVRSRRLTAWAIARFVIIALSKYSSLTALFLHLQRPVLALAQRCPILSTVPVVPAWSMSSLPLTWIWVTTFHAAYLHARSYSPQPRRRRYRVPCNCLCPTLGALGVTTHCAIIECEQMHTRGTYET